MSTQVSAEDSRNSQASLAQSLLSHCSFLWVLGHTRLCLCPPRVSVSPVLWKFCNQILLAFKVKFPGGLQSLCWIPRLGNLLFTLELSQQCENFFGIIVLQFVGYLLRSSMVGLMVTSSKGTYTTRHASQVCCSQSPCPWSRSLLTHVLAGDTQILKGRSGSVSVGFLGTGIHKVLLEASKHL